MAKTLLALIFMSTAALADDISPGSWQIMMETRVPAEPGFAPPAFQLTQCLTAEDARDPSRVLGGVSNPGASGCNYTDKSYSGNTFTFAMTCGGGLTPSAAGDMRRPSPTFTGSPNVRPPSDDDAT